MFTVCASLATTLLLFANAYGSGWEPLPSRKICGLQHADDRFSDKTETSLYEHPWMVILGYHSEVAGGNFSELCTGTLINNKYVLTTGFCISYINQGFDLIARFGEYDRRNETDCMESQGVKVCSNNVIDLRFENYTRYPPSPGLIGNDVGLLRLKRNVEYSDFIKPICLPTAGVKNVTTGDTLTFSGFGFGSANVGSYFENHLKKRTLNKVLSHEECLNRWFSMRKHVRLNQNHFCTEKISTNSERDPCQGDRGGPAMSKHNNQWQQDGIISHEDCEKGRGKIVTRVANYMDWILQNIYP